MKEGWSPYSIILQVMKMAESIYYYLRKEKPVIGLDFLKGLGIGMLCLILVFFVGAGWGIKYHPANIHYHHHHKKH